MTDQQLRDELHRIAEAAPEAYVPADIFVRGRRAHRRSVVIAIGAISAAIAFIAGSVALSPTRDSAEIDPARGYAGLAVADTLYAAPTWLAESEDGRYTHADDLEQDLAIGVGAIAYVQPAEDSNTAVPVVVDADDGDYHPLDLPDFIGLDPYWENGIGEGFGHRPLALSTDGRQLAWAWGRGRSAPEDAPVPGGVRVADLTTGNVVEWNLATSSCPATNCDDRGVYVSDLKWSDGGTKLLWAGSRMDRWDDESYVPGNAVAGVIDPGTTSATALAGIVDRVIYLSTWAVADDGTIAFSDGFGSGAVQLRSPSGDATKVALPINASAGEPVQFRGSELYIVTDAGMAPLDGSGATYARPNGSQIGPIGWAGDAPLITAFGNTGGVRIVQLGTSGDDARVLIECDDAGSVVDTVSVAYALIDPDAADPTVSRIPPIFLPPWLKTTAFYLFIGLIAVALWRWRRRTRAVRPSRRTANPEAVVMFVVLSGLVAALLFQSSATFTFDLSPDEPGGVVAIPSATSTSAPGPTRAVIPQDIRWTESPEKYVPLSDSLAVGRATLAFPDQALVVDGGSAVVLTVDGKYHRLRLPGVGEAWSMMEEQGVRLSADGTRMAYVTEDKSLNVIDLESGKVTEHPLEIDGRVTSFSWSPNSKWLVWDSDYEHRAAGRIAPDGTAEPLPRGRWEHAGIGDDGTVVVRNESGTKIWPGSATDLPGTGQEGLSTWVGADTPVDGVDHPGVRSIGWDSGRNIDLAIGRNPSVRGVDVDGRDLIGVAGWLADGTPLIVTSDGDGQDLRTASPDGETQVVAHLDHRVTRLTIATALPADLAVTAPDQDWTWTSQLSTNDLPTVLLAAAVIGLAVFVVWLWVRSARRGRRGEL
ncbi:WD40 repeat domain-containing protein [Nocardioides albus]|uniref:WD40 repeat domain-containing protein n=1 Tax=Nocardioides albus TaxID=1841 RepID=A0A7W5A232_9ACTN|nr:WD40 repeat domain-containing protein [Nocardioides albus]MBB3088216.1 hypothetical protein [Nocardioides albus]GGU23270.1 hypothetical protein GCM10007979_22830 [Nocardioides albus]